jgi:hypothetical protein
MSISRVQANWASVSFFPTGASSIPLTRITTGSFDQGGNLSKFKADVDLYTSLVAVLDVEPTASFTSADVGTFFGITPGSDGVLTATLNDAKLVSLGGVVFTCSHAVFGSAQASAAHAAFATVTGTWDMYAPDGQTPPITISRV